MRKKSSVIVSVFSVLFSAGMSILTIFLPFQKNYYLTAVLMIIASIVPFFSAFERRKMKTSELVVLAVMIAISCSSRVLFSFVPQAKPMAAFVAVSGIAFGANAGFAVGAVSIFASNFFMGRGMFTPFQMLGMGLVGFFSGLIFFKKPFRKNKLFVCLAGFLLTFFVYGIVVDTCSVFMMLSEFSFSSVLSIYASGIVFNLIHAVTTAIILFLISNPMNNKFERLRIKYGVFD